MSADEKALDAAAEQMTVEAVRLLLREARKEGGNGEVNIEIYSWLKRYKIRVTPWGVTFERPT